MVRFAALLALLAALAPAQVRIVGVEDWGWSSGAEHTRVKGRIVDAHGASLAGAGVRLRAALSAKTTLYETRTGADGDFEFPDVDFDGQIEAVVDPPAEWLPTSFEIVNVSGVFDAGEIRLAPAASLQVMVQTAPWQIYRGDTEALSVKVRPSERDTVTSYADGVFSIDRLPCGPATLTVLREGIPYEVKLVLAQSQRDRMLVARIPPNPNATRSLEIVETRHPWAPPPPLEVGGTVRAADGRSAESWRRFDVDRRAAGRPSPAEGSRHRRERAARSLCAALRQRPAL